MDHPTANWPAGLTESEPGALEASGHLETLEDTLRKLMTVALLVAIAVALPAVLAQSRGDAAAGKAVYAAKCATCHGPAGEGKDAIAKMMKVELRHLGSKEVQAKSDAEWKKEIDEGVGKMKPVKLAKDADMANLIAYMRMLKK